MLMSHAVPTKYLERFDRYSSSYLVLGHLVGSDAQYTEFFAESKTWKYLDNSAYELGESIADSELIRKAHLIKAHAIVLPDVFMKGKETLERTHKFLDNFKEAHEDFEFVAVPQGSNAGEYLDCASELLKIKEIDTLGISFLVTAKCFSPITQTEVQNVLANRPLAVGLVKQLMRHQDNQLSIHLLGLGDPIELSCYAKYGGVDGVVSCDSSVAFSLAKKDIIVGSLGYARKVFDHVNFDEADTSEETLLLAGNNIRRINSFI